jgi:transketolase
VGLTHFDYSAPYTVLDEKLGYTGENVYKKAVEFLNL